MKALRQSVNEKMPVRELIFGWFAEHFREIADALAGSLVYLAYGVWYKGRDWSKALAAFFIGTLFALYVSPQVCELWKWVDRSFAGFFFGLMGMRMTEIILEYDLKALANALIEKFLKK